MYLNENDRVSLKGRFDGRATPLVDRVSESCISGLSKDVYNFSVAQVFREITAVKVERSKKNVRFSTKTDIFFELLILTAGHF